MSIQWYAQNINYITHELNTDLEQGLSTTEVSSRLQQYGYNDVYHASRPSWMQVLSYQLTSFSGILLAITASVSLLLFDAPGMALIVSGMLLAHIVLRHLQYTRVNRVKQILSAYPIYKARVLRNGRLVEIHSRELVPGDVILIKAGDRIPADARLFETVHLNLDESFITGRAEPVTKQSGALPSREVPINEQQNMIFAGTFALKGEGRAIVVATGHETELSHTYALLGLEANIETESEIHLGYLERFGLTMGVAFGAVLAVVGWFTRSQPTFQEAFAVGMSFAVAAIPNGLVALATSILAFNTYRILRMEAVARSLNDIEPLSTVTAVCVEHTGGFTQAEMRVQQIFVDARVIPQEQFGNCFELLTRDEANEDETEYLAGEADPARAPVDLPLLMIVASLSTDTLSGEPLPAPFDHATEMAITEAAAEIGIDKTEYQSILTRLKELPSDGKRWRRLIFRNSRNQMFLFAIGDTELVLRNSLYIQLDGRPLSIKDEQRKTLLITNHHFLSENSRILAVAYRRINPKGEELQIEDIATDELTFLGLLALNDPLHDGVQQAIQDARNSGLKTIMMIDEEPERAAQIAQDLGILQNHIGIMEGHEFESLSEDQLAERLDRMLVYCEPTAEHRAAIVRHLQSRGYSVAVMGNRPEHAHVLRTADVGVCTANQASDIALEASALVLHEGGFNRLLLALVQARQTCVSIRNSIRWLLSCHVGMATTIGLAFVIHIFYGQQFVMPLSLPQLLWISLIVTVVPVFALETDTINVPISYTRPHRSGYLFAGGYKLDICLRGLVIALMALVGFVFTMELYKGSPDMIERARTTTMNVLLLTQLLFIFQCHRRFVEPMGHRLLSNRKLLITIAVVVLIQLMLIYLPVVNTTLNLVALGWQEWLFILGFCIIALLPLDMVSRRH